MSEPRDLDELLREHYDTGAYGRARLVMAKATALALPKPAPRGVWDPSSTLGQVFGIPVMLDDAEPVGCWRVIDQDGRELAHGGPLTDATESSPAAASPAGAAPVSAPTSAPDGGGAVFPSAPPP